MFSLLYSTLLLFNFIQIHKILLQSKLWLFYSIFSYSVLFFSVLFVVYHKVSVAWRLSSRSEIQRTWVWSPPWSILFYFSIGKTSINFWKTSGNLRKIYVKFRRRGKTTEMHMYLPSPQTGNVFRSMVLRHPIICTEINVQSFNSVI